MDARMGACYSSTNLPDSSATRPYEPEQLAQPPADCAAFQRSSYRGGTRDGSRPTRDHRHRRGSLPIGDQELILRVQPTHHRQPSDQPTPLYPVAVNMSQVEKSPATAAGNGKAPSGLAKFSSRLPKFGFSRPKPDARLPASVLAKHQTQVSSSSSLSSADAGSSNSCKSTDSINARKARLTCVQPPAAASSASTLYTKHVKPKSTSSLARPRPVASKCLAANKVSPQAPAVAARSFAYEPDPPTNGGQVKPPQRFTTQISSVPKPQTAQLVLTSSFNGPARVQTQAEPRRSCAPKTSPTTGSSIPAFRPGTNAYNPYKRFVPPVRKPVEVPTAVPAAAAPSLPRLISKSSGSLLGFGARSKEPSTITGDRSVQTRIATGLPGRPSVLPTFAQLRLQPSAFGSSSEKRQTAPAELVDHKLTLERKQSPVEPAKNGLCDRADIVDAELAYNGNVTGYKMLRRTSKKSSLGSAGNSNPISSESNSTYTSPSTSPDKGSHEPSRSDFLIDDEICDQPQLILNEKNDADGGCDAANSDRTISSGSSLHSSPAKSTISCSINELATLKMKQAILDSSNLTAAAMEELSLGRCTPRSPLNGVRLSNSFSGSRTASVNTFRTPRPLSVVESSDGTIEMDGSSKRCMMQDINGIKTLLFRLQGEVQNAGTVNPFSEALLAKHRQSVDTRHSEEPVEEEASDFYHENFDLRRQLLLLQQQLDEKDRTIRLLQQQMTKYLNIKETGGESPCKKYSNSTTQTEKCCANGFAPRASSTSNGMVVSDEPEICVHCDGIPLVGESEC